MIARQKYERWLRGAASLGAIVLIWMAVTGWELVPRVFLPSPFAVGASLFTGIADGSLIRDLMVSCGRVFAAFGISVSVALPIGLWLGLSPSARGYLEPLNDFIRYIPVPAIVPLIILWLGLGNGSQIAVIVFGTLPQLLVLVADAASRLPLAVQEMCRSMHLTRTQTLWHAVIPYSSPQIYDGSRVAMGWAWSYLLVAEIVGATFGLGQAIIVAQRFLQTPRVIAVILLVAVLGLSIDLVLRRLYFVCYPWVSETRQ